MRIKDLSIPKKDIDYGFKRPDFDSIFSLLPIDAVITEIYTSIDSEFVFTIESDEYPYITNTSDTPSLLSAAFISAILAGRKNSDTSKGIGSEASIIQLMKQARSDLKPLAEYTKNFSKVPCNCDMEYSGLKTHHERCAVNGK